MIDFLKKYLSISVITISDILPGKLHVLLQYGRGHATAGPETGWPAAM